jgi:hypothetical protein
MRAAVELWQRHIAPLIESAAEPSVDEKTVSDVQNAQQTGGAYLLIYVVYRSELNRNSTPLAGIARNPGQLASIGENPTRFDN